jgi:hypothetical protein
MGRHSLEIKSLTRIACVANHTKKGKRKKKEKRSCGWFSFSLKGRAQVAGNRASNKKKTAETTRHLWGAEEKGLSKCCWRDTYVFPSCGKTYRRLAAFCVWRRVDSTRYNADPTLEGNSTQSISPPALTILFRIALAVASVIALPWWWRLPLPSA